MSRHALTTLICLAAWMPGILLAAEVDLRWLQGHWCSDAGDEQIEEYWLEPSAGESVGISRTMTEGSMTSFEYMRITNKGPDTLFTAQPGGSTPTVFTATDSGKDWLVFENPEHDFPQRIEYRREADRLLARISGPGEGGAEMSFGFEYHTCP